VVSVLFVVEIHRPQVGEEPFHRLGRHLEMRDQLAREVVAVEGGVDLELRVDEADALQLDDRVGDILVPILAHGLDHADGKAMQRDVEDMPALAREPRGKAAQLVMVFQQQHLCRFGQRVWRPVRPARPLQSPLRRSGVGNAFEPVRKHGVFQVGFAVTQSAMCCCWNTITSWAALPRGSRARAGISSTSRCMAFPIGMIKSVRKYWNQDIADSIVQLKGIRFVNPQFQIDTTFDRDDFTRQLVTHFKVPAETVERFFTDLRAMNFYDNNTETTGEMFDRYFPGRDDVKRLLMEPIAYANGSTLEDPAITFGIVFSNFMSKGVYTFRGGSDLLIKKMSESSEERRRGSQACRRREDPDREIAGKKQVTGVVANGRTIRCDTVLSKLQHQEHRPADGRRGELHAGVRRTTKAVRINTSSCQVYLGIRKGESIPHIGDLVFTSDAKHFTSGELVDLHTTSRTFSVYYPDTRPGSDRYTVVCSLNSTYGAWKNLTEEEYAKHKARLIEESITALERYIPDVRGKLDWTEPLHAHHRVLYPPLGRHVVRHKVRGLKVSMDLPSQLPGLYHAGSVASSCRLAWHDQLWCDRLQSDGQILAHKKRAADALSA